VWRIQAQRGVWTASVLVAFAALTCLSALGNVDAGPPRVSGAITLSFVLLVLPFALGAIVGSRWILAFVFSAVIAPALLLDRTVFARSTSDRPVPRCGECRDRAVDPGRHRR
jgi:hypothetical protein